LGQPFYYVGADTYEVDVTYYNGFDTNITGTANLVIRNNLGQTVGVDMTTTTIPAGQNRTLHPSVNEPLPPGTYSTSVFATNGGVVISNVTSGSFQQKYFLLFQSFSSESDSTSVGVGLTNVSPVPVQGILWGFLNDTLGDVVSSVSQNITAAANSQATVDLVFPSADANISYCFLEYTFIVLAPNGTALSPRDHESPADVCQDFFHFPMTPPVEAALGAFQTLQTTVTNIAPFSVTLVFIGQVQNSNNNEVAVATSTLALGAGQVSTDYLAVLGLPCGGYTVQISVKLIAPPSLPPDTPQFSSGSFDAPFRVC
jgi:hypothetical protein